MPEPGELTQLDRQIAHSLRQKQPGYRFEPLDNYSELSDKVFVATIGPSEAGKSTLTNEVIRLDPEFTPVGTRTTRARKPSDPEKFQTANEGITHLTFNEDVISRRLVNFSIFDTDHAYGTAPEDIGPYAIGPILSDSIENLSTVGFKRFYPVFVVARGALYQHRLEQNRLHDPDIKDRLLEAGPSLAFAERYADESWLEFVDTGDSHEELVSSAFNVINMAHQGTHLIMPTHQRLQLIKEMRVAVQNVLSQLP